MLVRKIPKKNFCKKTVSQESYFFLTALNKKLQWDGQLETKYTNCVSFMMAKIVSKHNEEKFPFTKINNSYCLKRIMQKNQKHC